MLPVKATNIGRLELRELQDLIEVKSKLDHQDYFTFAQAAQLMGVSRQYIYKLVKEDKLRALRISARMSIIRRADIELMLKTRPYERRRIKDDLDITEYYNAEQISEKYKVSQKWIWAYTREDNIPKIRIRQFNYYSKKHIDTAFAKYKTDDALTEWYTPDEIEQKYGMSRVTIPPMSIETTSRPRKNTVRYSTQSYILTYPSRLPKIILRNTIPYRKP